MKNLNKLKLYTMLILSIAIIFTTIPLSASNIVRDIEHEMVIKQYISDIKDVQNHVFSLSQIVVGNLPEDLSRIRNEINFINIRIQELSRTVLLYTRSTPSISFQNRDALLVCVALNLLKNSLYQLNMLIYVDNNVDKSILLEDFYLFKRISIETLETLEKNF
ncbi:hypothetical protein [Cellulosilyticum sp. I15G10I2]|uniref:hypothetical protein n=1 Tax=Cellulosilyticum sp. I15G10I2 TaxID=1892843 RepID=UPI00085C51E7|nr:hypothetical protein [Cellulosilyticum sp. I15G10I2]